MGRFCRASLLAAVCAVSLAACGRGGPAEDASPKPVAEVTTAVLADGSLDATVRAYGAVEFAPGAERTLTAPLDAKVVAVWATPGSTIAAARPVVQLSPSPQAQVDLKKAAEDSAASQAAYDRALRLRASGLDSDADVESARAADAVAAATLQSLKARAAGLTVRSPVAGVVEALDVSPGDTAAAGASLAKVGQLGATRVRLGLDPAAAAEVRPGAAVRLRPTGGGEAGAGRVRSLDPQVDPLTRMASVVVDLSGMTLAPGRTVEGDIVIGRVRGPEAPRAAVYYDQDQPYVLVVQDGTVHRRDVKLGPERGDRVELASGVRSGERIVIDGGASLDDGAAVREAPATSAAGGGDAGG